MNKLYQIPILVLIVQSFSIEAETYVSPFCPVLDINTTTQFHFEKAINNLFSEHEYQDDLIQHGIDQPVLLNELRLLKTETDSAVCQKLNERTMLPNRYRYDRELRRYIPELYATYYELRGAIHRFPEGLLCW